MKNENIKITDKNSKIDLKRRSYDFALDVIKFVESLNGDQASKIIGGQLLRSATSIGANIIEAQAAGSKKDFTNYLRHSLKSANETKFWLGLIIDSNRAKKNAGPLLNEATELSNILASSILTLKRKQF